MGRGCYWGKLLRLKWCDIALVSGRMKGDGMCMPKKITFEHDLRTFGVARDGGMTAILCLK